VSPSGLATATSPDKCDQRPVPNRALLLPFKYWAFASGPPYPKQTLRTSMPAFQAVHWLNARDASCAGSCSKIYR